MALANPQTPFLWGQGGQMMTPEQVARERARAEAQAAAGADYSPIQHIAQGLARLANAGVGRWRENIANDAEQAGLADFRSGWEQVFSGGGRASPVAAALAGTEAPAVAAIDAVSAPGGVPVAGGSGTEWLNYSNTNATRNLPLADALVTAMGFLPELGVTMEVFSGGQPEAGQGARVGSTRHDHGNAADVQFYRDGRMLDWNNPDDIPLLSNIVARARANGVTGIGAGDDYMGPGRMHIGFGPEAVWGAGGRSANAPDWLRSAFYGAEAPAAASGARGSSSPVASALAGQGGYDMNALIGLASHPYASDAQRQIVGSLISQQMQANDPMRQMQMEMMGLELEAMRNPQVAPPAPVFEGGQWWDVSTGQPMPLSERAVDPATSIQEYQFYADQAAASGQQPMPYDQWDIARRQSGATNINLGDQGQQMGAIPAGMAAVQDPTNPSGFRLEAIPGGPAALAAEEAAAQAGMRAGQTQRYADVVLEDITRAIDALGAGTTGIVGSWTQGIPGTPAHDLSAILQTVRSNIGFDRLQAMREASPTGGALGAVSDFENRQLQATLGNLEQSQSEAQLRRNLERVREVYLNIIHGEGNWDPETGMPSGAQEAPQGGGGLPGEAAAQPNASTAPVQQFVMNRYQQNRARYDAETPPADWTGPAEFWAIYTPEERASWP